MKISVQGLSFAYGSEEILRGITLQVSPGEMLSIIGPNGSGKSTLLRCMARILIPQKGAVFLDGKEAGQITSRELARLMGYVPQSVSEVLPFTVLETVLMGRKPHVKWGVSKKDLDIVAGVLKYMEIEDMAQRYLDSLSGGQKQKVFIARSLAQEPQIFLFDEPTSNLDIRHQLEVMELVKNLVNSQKRLVVMVLHDLNLAARFSDQLVMLRDGRIFAAGRPPEVLTGENIKEVYGVEVAVAQSSIGPYVVPLKPAPKKYFQAAVS